MGNLAEEICTSFSRGRSSSETAAHWRATAWEEMEFDLIKLVYGSNRIASAGNSFSITVQLCQSAFRDEVTSAAIERGDPTLKEHGRFLRASRRSVNLKNIWRSRREILQHAYALGYMIDHIVLDRNPWSEELILETHRVLLHCLKDGVQPGCYRSYELAVKDEGPDCRHTLDPRMPSMLIPRYMSDMIERLNRDTARADAGELDPYTLAARYHNYFVLIHPFANGNGRMARIVLNCLMLRHAGHVSDLGVEADERYQYWGITTRLTRIFPAEDLDPELLVNSRNRELAEMLRRTGQGADGFWAV
ncbi:fido domain-containing protein [Corynascus similis CBS 632.67]